MIALLQIISACCCKIATVRLWDVLSYVLAFSYKSFALQVSDQSLVSHTYFTKALLTVIWIILISVVVLYPPMFFVVEMRHGSKEEEERDEEDEIFNSDVALFNNKGYTRTRTSSTGVEMEMAAFSDSGVVMILSHGRRPISNHFKLILWELLHFVYKALLAFTLNLCTVDSILFILIIVYTLGLLIALVWLRPHSRKEQHAEIVQISLQLVLFVLTPILVYSSGTIRTIVGWSMIAVAALTFLSQGWVFFAARGQQLAQCVLWILQLPCQIWALSRGTSFAANEDPELMIT